MAIKTTRWSPDTCDCVVEYTWDTNDPESSRVHTPSNIVRRCAYHALLNLGLSENFANVLERNTRKNKVWNRYEANIVSWTYDEAGILRIVTTGLTTNQRTTAQTWCDTNLGPGKVVIS